MKFKRFLIALMAVSVVIYLIYIARIYERVSGIFVVFSTPQFWAYAAIAFAFILGGHWVRSLKIKLLLRPVKDSGVRTQFQSLLIGYLFNTLLPLRLGEIVRAIVLGRSLKISSSFMFALIILERAFDGLILGGLGLALLLYPGLLPAEIRDAVALFSGLLLLVAVSLIVLLVLLYRQDAKLLRFWYRFTALFNHQLKNSLRFKLWSVIYGLHKVLNLRAISLYAARSVAMWALYLAALMVLASFFFPYHLGINFLQAFISFLGVSIPSGPAYLGSYQAVADPLFQILAPGAGATHWLVASWMLLAIPSSVLGAALLLRHRTDYSTLLAARNIDSLHDKLARVGDTSQEFTAFLDAYFSRNTVSHILHRLEIDEDIRLIKYFKGGSDASTILVHQEGTYVVKKIIPGQYAHRLKAQHDWLKEYSHHDHVVKLIKERETPAYYSIDIEYYPDYTPFFDYIHTQDLDKSQRVVREIFEFLFEHVYKLKPKSTNEQALTDFIQSKLWGKLDQASKLNHELAALREYDRLIINGREYDNIHRVMKKIKNHKKIWHDLATYREGVIHGDVTVDNILTSSKNHTFKIIDPAPDQNEIAGPIFDFGRHYQSLGYGYEFLCRDDSATISNGNVISYEDSISAHYRDLQKYFRDLSREWLEPEEHRAMIFHTAILYSRVLAHRVHINPRNVAKFYAVSVRAFNDFLAQYDDVEATKSEPHTDRKSHPKSKH